MFVNTNSLKNIIKENKTLLRGGLFSIYSFVNRGFAFILLLILANYIAPAEYGYLSLFSTVVMVLGYFIALSSEGYMSISYFSEGESGISKSFSCILIISIFISFLLCLVLLACGESLSRLLDLERNILIFAVIIAFFTVFNNLLLDFFRIREKVVVYGWLSCGSALLNFIISIILVKGLLLSWQGRVYAWMGCTVLFGLIGLWLFFKLGYFTSQIHSFIKPMLIWSIPLIPHLATTFIRQGCDRYIINYYHTIDDVGLFSFALNLVGIVTMVGYGFNQSNSVDIFKVLGDKLLPVEEKLQYLKKNRKIFLLLYFVITLLIAVIGYILIPIVLPKYTDSVNYFLVLSVYGFFVCVYLVYTNYLFFYKKTKKLMYITVSSAFIHLLLSFWLTRYNLYVTALLYGITQAGTAVFVGSVALKELRMISKMTS
jgi:O-antigen/teichoic acid export membrane protein